MSEDPSATNRTSASLLPRWLPWANRLVGALQRLGARTGTIHLLSVPGRVSGRMHKTPVSLLTVNGKRYIVGGLENADWVRNARAAGWGVLYYGRIEEPISLVELPAAERESILRQFPRLVPHGVPFFTRLYGVGADPEAFAALADRCPVFRVESRRA
jgi:hypothetical protein